MKNHSAMIAGAAAAAALAPCIGYPALPPHGSV